MVDLESRSLLILNTKSTLTALLDCSEVLGELLGEVVVGEVPEQLRLLLAEQTQPDLGSELLDHNLAAFEVLNKHAVPDKH